MLYSEQMHQICEKLGVKREECKDGLYSTLLQAICDACDGGGGGNSGGGEEWIGDGNTHIWISLQEGRTSPMLGVAVNGTVTVDWGDGSEPDTLTGTSASAAVYTPVHNYAKSGDYVITLSGGEIGVWGSSSGTSYLLVASADVSNKTNYAYASAIQKVELGSNVTRIGGYAFCRCYSLANVNIPDGVTSIGSYAFQYCYSLANVHIPDSVTSISSMSFQYCHSLANVNIPDGVRSIGNQAFQYCYSLANVNIPDGVTSIDPGLFSTCYSLVSVHIPGGVTSIGVSAFQYCYSVAYCDFSKHTAVPTLAATNAFSGIPADCEIRVPAALVDEWKAATNWSTYADYIVGV